MTRTKTYDRPERKRGLTGAPPSLTQAQARYIRKAMALRKKLSRKALAIKFGVSPHTIGNYTTGRVKRYRVAR